jgi:AraC family carnitine catabolism transcriptional activator
MPDFSSFDLGVAIEVLSTANEIIGHNAFRWRLVCEPGQNVSSSGMAVVADHGLPTLRNGDRVVVCGGRARIPAASPPIRGWLRAGYRLGCTFGVLGSGAHILAGCGIVNGRALSTHWLLEPALAEAFPNIRASSQAFAYDDRLLSCGGGATTIDLMIAHIARRHGTSVASGVADRLLCGTLRTQEDRQTRSQSCRLGLRNKKLSVALRVMSARLGDPPPPSEVARLAGVSVRQLERMFQAAVEMTPKAYMTRLRLERARLLLQQSDMSVIEVAVTCGFTSSSHFAKVYRARYGVSPSSESGLAKTT